MQVSKLGQLFNQLEKTTSPFPAGKEVNGVDLTLLDSYIAGYASRRPVANAFTAQDVHGIEHSRIDLDKVWPDLIDTERQYFSTHRAILEELRILLD